jgi:Do/DeqQ family serine protease
MKNIASLIIAGVFGGLIVLAGVFMLQPKEQINYSNQTYAAVPVNNINVARGMAKPAFDFTEAAQKVTPVVVHIASAESSDVANRRNKEYSDPFQQFFGSRPQAPKRGTGSGVIISEDGYIVTNNHVIEFADDINVTLSNNRQYKAEVVGTYEKGDLAVLKIEAQGLPTLEYADSDAALIGQWVLAVGNPLELTSTVTAGIISAKGRDLDIIPGREAIESFIQTDAAVNPGNSGGALVDDNGRLLGINTAIATQTGFYSGYSFAIPVNIMKKIVDDIIEYGSYQRGYLGVSITDLDDDLAKELGLDISQGVVVASVQDGSAAQYAGILPNDVIVKVDGKSVISSPELQELVGRAKVGDNVKLEINRNGDKKEFPVRLKGN